MTPGSIAIVAMGGEGQYQRLRPLIAALADRQIEISVFTDQRFEADALRLGVRFVDLFAGRPLDAADNESRPITCRYVSFAGHFADDVAREVAAVRPSLVMGDTFALVGRVVADQLRLPYVNLCHGHDLNPAIHQPALEADPRVHLSERCHEAVELLRTRYGLVDASPMSFLTGQSDVLNIYFEPAPYLSPETEAAFSPVVCFGSLPSTTELEARARRPAAREFPDAPLKVFVSFGTLVWGTFAADPRWTSAADALGAVQALAATFATRADVTALISLGRGTVAPEVVDAMRHPNVRVEPYVDQWQVLAQSDLFVTHNGLNSTHEAIFHEVPMVSYPFFMDHPPLAEKCQTFGLAVPLTEAIRAPVAESDVTAALDACVQRRDALAEALARAHQWELDVIAEREGVVDRVVGLL